ncbi:hypothetical protein QCA50_007661 [Cerrena zonata]|uniref:Carboxymuconolactone decarboxylase-like domain-containing protein n=1 Tax=Cerrena zonata TaxID=2478898 RepID=A0AAW0GCU0_9APHY
MAHLASPQLLQRLRGLYPTQAGNVSHPWYIVTAVAFSASNKPDAAAAVFKYALEDLETSNTTENLHATKLTVAKKTREAILQSGLLSGYARAINSLVALHGVTPPELQEKSIVRDTNKHLNEVANHGERLFQAMYGNNAANVQTLLDKVYPDMGWFSNTVGYGITYGGTDILTQSESSFVIATANICMDTPRQIAWHLANARNGGATLEETKAVRQIAMEVASTSGVQWTDEVPETCRILARLSVEHIFSNGVSAPLSKTFQVDMCLLVIIGEIHCSREPPSSLEEELVSVTDHIY